MRFPAGLLLLSIWMAAAACEPPPVVATQDKRQRGQLGRIDGDVVVSGKSRGDAVLFLFDVSRPTKPTSFAFISRGQLFGSSLLDASAGPFSAAYSFSLVPSGRYVIKAFLDVDGCLNKAEGCQPADFIPWYGVTSEPNQGDLIGGALDLTTPGALRVIEVPALPNGAAGVATEANVTLAQVVGSRPIFEVEGSGVILPGDPPKQLRLRPHPLRLGPISQTAPDLVRLPVGAFIRKLAVHPSNLIDENDVDKNGVIDSKGVEYDHLAGGVDGKPDHVELRAVVQPDPEFPTALLLTIFPEAFDKVAGVPLAVVPKGRYAIILARPAAAGGQTWRVPNELQPHVAGSLGLPADTSQAFFIDVQ